MAVMIWSDFVCPFCNVARERAEFLRREAGARVEWLPFDLHPEYPPEGIPRAELARRYGEHFSDAVRRMNEEAGLVYNPHPERVPNSRRALELAEWARARGSYDDLHERIMDAYWSEGRDITGWDVLAPIVAEAGLDADEARAEVDAGAFRAPVERVHARGPGARDRRRAGLRAGRPPARQRRPAARRAPGRPREGQRDAGGGGGGLTGSPRSRAIARMRSSGQRGWSTAAATRAGVAPRSRARRTSSSARRSSSSWAACQAERSVASVVRPVLALNAALDAPVLDRRRDRARQGGEAERDHDARRQSEVRTATGIPITSPTANAMGRTRFRRAVRRRPPVGSSEGARGGLMWSAPPSPG